MNAYALDFAGGLDQQSHEGDEALLRLKARGLNTEVAKLSDAVLLHDTRAFLPERQLGHSAGTAAAAGINYGGSRHRLILPVGLCSRLFGDADSAVSGKPLYG